METLKFDWGKVPAGVTSVKADAETELALSISLNVRFTVLTVFITKPVGDCETTCKPFNALERETVPGWPGVEPVPPLTLVVPVK